MKNLANDIRSSLNFDYIDVFVDGEVIIVKDITVGSGPYSAIEIRIKRSDSDILIKTVADLDYRFEIHFSKFDYLKSDADDKLIIKTAKKQVKDVLKEYEEFKKQIAERMKYLDNHLNVIKV